MTDPRTSFVPLAFYTRGRQVESVHFGAFAVVTAEGRVLASAGEIHRRPIFLRSTAKPFQALPFVEAGGPAHFGFTAREVALMCASHSGTDEHVAVLQQMQARIPITAEDLQCGMHEPMHKATARALWLRQEPLTPLRHNCSGKHTGMLAFARLLDAPRQTYLEPTHPVQQRILQTVAEMCDWPVEKIEMGTDGCSAPNFALPLYNAALGLARLTDPRNLPPQRQEACRFIVDAMTAHPDMVAGPERFDTDLMRATDGRILAKGGAEGYQGLALRPGVLSPAAPGVGIAIKISDGDPKSRARALVAMRILEQLNALSAQELERLASYGPQVEVRNWRQLHVGEGGPLF